MVEQSLKEVVKAMCKAYPGGREAMAGAIGMSVTQFNNNLYEKNGCPHQRIKQSIYQPEDKAWQACLAPFITKGKTGIRSRLTFPMLMAVLSPSPYTP